MYVRTRRRIHGNTAYEYVDIVESRRVGGKVVQTTLGSLGRRDLLGHDKVDRLIEHLRKLASPEGLHGIRLGEMAINATRQYGPVRVARLLWEELGLDKLLEQIPHPAGVPLEEAVFRMVANRLCQPSSKQGLVDWVDDQGLRHPGWQGKVEWPSGTGDLEYHQYLRAMDRLHPHREEIEDELFKRVTDLLSLPLNLVLYDLTTTYFEGEGACELAAFGYSRDHRQDRRQVAMGLAVTQEGIPITHRVYKGNTADVTTFAPMARELRQRFGLPEMVLVADRGMFSEDNIAELEQGGIRYVLALRDRASEEGEQAVAMAFKAGLPVPKGRKAPPPIEGKTVRMFRVVELFGGIRHLVVHSSHLASHDYEVRDRRLRKATEALAKLRADVQSAKKPLGVKTIVQRATRALVEAKASRYFDFHADKGFFHFWLRRDVYRRQRRHDGLFVLRTNHPDLRGQAILDTYLQLPEVERCFRVIKSVVKVRPMHHWRQRRVETHIFLNCLAFLLARILEQKLKAAEIEGTIPWALEQLQSWQAVEHTWEGRSIVVQTSKPSPEVKAILAALGIRIGSPVIRVTQADSPSRNDSRNDG